MFGVERAGLELLFGSAGFFALSGFVGGATFSMLLSLADGRRTFDELSLPRFGGWGALAGGLTYAGGLMLFGDGWGPFALAMTTIAAVLGSGSATSSLALARRADKRLIDASSMREAAELDDGASEALPGSPPQ